MYAAALKAALGMASISLLAGCATQLNSVFRRPIIEDTVEPGTIALSMDATRRSIVLHTDSEANLVKLCAEPPPDAADKITAALEFAIEATLKRADGNDKGTGRATVSDTFGLDVIKLAERSEVSDIYRSSLYALCQYHVNGAMTSGQLVEQYETLVERVFDVLDTRARIASSNAPGEREDRSAPITQTESTGGEEPSNQIRAVNPVQEVAPVRAVPEVVR